MIYILQNSQKTCRLGHQSCIKNYSFRIFLENTTSSFVNTRSNPHKPNSCSYGQWMNKLLLLERRKIAATTRASHCLSEFVIEDYILSRYRTYIHFAKFIFSFVQVDGSLGLNRALHLREHFLDWFHLRFVRF